MRLWGGKQTKVSIVRLCAIVLLALGLSASHCANLLAQEDHAGTPSRHESGVPVKAGLTDKNSNSALRSGDGLAAFSVDGERIGSFEASLGPLPPGERARIAMETIENARNDPRFIAGSLTVVSHDRYSVVESGNWRLLIITEGDANFSGTSHEILASVYCQRLKKILSRAPTDSHAPERLITRLQYAGAATGILLVCFIVLGFTVGKMRGLLESWRGKFIRTIRIQQTEILNEASFFALLTGLLKLIGTLTGWMFVFWYSVAMLGFFPQTEHLSVALNQQVLSAAKDLIAPAIIGYAPDLFFLIVIFVATRYVLRFFKFLAGEMERGALSLPGFEQEWISPTWNIVRFLVIVFAVMLAFPYLPGSGSPAFQQITIFLGVLVSLGSTSAVSHVISGLFLTYTGAFKMNDRVKIADTVGDVVQKSLLATRIRTAKQEYITVPNGLVLGSHIVNYSSSGADPGLILHTTVTLGYDVPWRKIHEALKEAARKTEGILQIPEPFVLQTALNDFNVAYQINAYTNRPHAMARIYSELHENIQDQCSDVGIEILSPVYQVNRKEDFPPSN